MNAPESAGMKITLWGSTFERNAKLVCNELHKPLFTPQDNLLVSLENTPNLDNELLISVLIKELKAKTRLNPKDHQEHIMYQTTYKFKYTHYTFVRMKNSYFWD